jgi:hypothetical protein
VSKGLQTPVYLDELYAYDEVYRLLGTERGELDFTDPENPVILSEVCEKVSGTNGTAVGR